MKDCQARGSHRHHEPKGLRSQRAHAHQSSILYPEMQSSMRAAAGILQTVFLASGSSAEECRASADALMCLAV